MGTTLRTQGAEKPENSTIALFCVDFIKDANTQAGSLVNSAGASLLNCLLNQLSTYFIENSNESNKYCVMGPWTRPPAYHCCGAAAVRLC